ncbi:expressed unknown protein [Seminavis robusta]|uniref:Uncharacterized protein n=1 Tax=Seminavis robusta TaxID=568900 RepID=A0A9N8EC63_9STRA|nr:expressed unknown protein [Seminavis robusta]|eukprot:Sro792_g203150.1 n/a (229) ;mRNA; f:34040-34816
MKSTLALISIFAAAIFQGTLAFAPSNVCSKQPSAISSPLFRAPTFTPPSTTTTSQWMSSIPMEPMTVDVAVSPQMGIHPWDRVCATVSDATQNLNALRQKIQKSGVATAISYSLVSNMFTTVALSLAWYGFSMQTGLSPISPGQWKPFLAWYGGFYAVNSLLKPVRFMIALGIVPRTEQLMALFQARFNDSKKAAVIASTSLLVVTSSTVMASAIGLASLCSGVPIFV